MATVTKPVALDESFNSTEATPRSVADVLADELVGIKQAITNQGGGGSGHTIQNASGSNMPQENTMQFKDSHVTDNSGAGKTEVEVIKSVASADYSSETEDGLYLLPDGDGSVIEPASEDYVEVTADGVKTYAELLNAIFAMADTSKINQGSCFVVAGANTFIAYPCYFGGSSEFRFTYSRISQTQSVFMTYKLSSSSGHYQDNNGTRTDESTSKPSIGTKLTLYYGNDKAVVDLQTTANRCLMSDGVTSVENALKFETFNLVRVNNADTINAEMCVRIGKVVYISGIVTFSSAKTGTPIICAKIPNAYAPPFNTAIYVCDDTNDKVGNGQVYSTSGEYRINLYRPSADTSVSVSKVRFFGVYVQS